MYSLLHQNIDANIELNLSRTHFQVAQTHFKKGMHMRCYFSRKPYAELQVNNGLAVLLNIICKPYIFIKQLHHILCILTAYKYTFLYSILFP